MLSSAVDSLHLAARSTPSLLLAGAATRLRHPHVQTLTRLRVPVSPPRASLPASCPDLPPSAAALRLPFGATVESVAPLSAATPSRSGASRAPFSSPSPFSFSSPALAMAADAATASEPAEVLVKAATGQPDQLGDCPFSQRVLMSLEEKGIPYSMKLVDTANKPEWFLEANPEGKVPVLKHEGKWVPDSDAIVEILEKEYPDSKKLATPAEHSSVGGGLFGAFARFLKGAGSEEDLVAQLKSLDEALAASGGPFVAGKEFTAVDAKLAPALYHLETALAHYKNWSIPAEYKHVLDYIKALESRESFKKTAAPKEVLIAGWNRALGVTA